MTPEQVRKHPDFKSYILIEKDYGIIEDTEGVGIMLLAMVDMALKLNPGNEDYLSWLVEELKQKSSLA